MRLSQKCSHSVRFSDTLLFFRKKRRKPFLFWYNRVAITLPRKDGFLMYIYYNRDQLILPMDLEIVSQSRFCGNFFGSLKTGVSHRLANHFFEFYP